MYRYMTINEDESNQDLCYNKVLLSESGVVWQETNQQFMHLGQDQKHKVT